MTGYDETLGAEEPWEAEIGALLAGLPAVDPPEGFISSALNHRPLYSGRIMAGLLMVLVAAAGAGLAVGASNGSLVAPEIDQLAQRHLQAEASLSTGDDDDGSVSNDPEPERQGESMSFMPSGYERTATFNADDLRQAVYAREGESISVFIQEGEVDWDALPVNGHTRVGGNRAWVDGDQSVTVVQAGDETITIVGLASAEVSELISELPGDGDTLGDRANELISALVAQFGFPAD